MKINHLVTPFKLNKSVIQASGKKGAFDCLAVDGPFPFRHNGKFYMLYIGFDGVGYQTGLAVSNDLVHWESLGAILKRDSHKKWDSVGMAASCMIMDGYDLYNCPKPKKIDGKYWLVYHAYPDSGYEEGPAAQGFAYTSDENLLEWEFLGDPVFVTDETHAWESGGLYKSFIVENDKQYFMFYNAKDKSKPWIEQTGIATSSDLYHWTRHNKNPVLPVTKNSWDSLFASDPAVWYDSSEKQWVMFYYGYNGKSAMDGIAVSKDLLHWEKFPAPILISGRGDEIDTIHAHKPGIIFHEGSLYHFYCASRPCRADDCASYSSEFRSISVARSKPW